MKHVRYLTILCLFIALFTPPLACGEDDQQTRMKWWREARFGMFVHWGPVSLKGTEIGWSRGGERRGTNGALGPIPIEVYDNLYKEFNPIEFNAKEWVEIAQKSGMRYLVFTTKHHDGFCNFDSALTDYKITNSPFKRDIVRELADACHAAKMPLGFYYSPPDWHHPDYRTENHQRYLEYMHGQIRELLTNYGKVDILWFDGLGGTKEDWDADNLVNMARDLQPEIIINNRAGLPEDHDTPEQQVGQYRVNRSWETCMTLCQQWSWKPDDKMKSLEECTDTLVRCAGGDGNLLFNVGPMPSGRIEERQVARLLEIGQWLKTNGDTIYGTRGGPFLPAEWGASTNRDNTVYLHVLNNKAFPLEFSPISAKITDARTLKGEKVKIHQEDGLLKIGVSMNRRDDTDTVVVLTLDKPAAEIKPSSTLSLTRNQAMAVRASNVYANDPSFNPEMALDKNPDTRWATDAGTRHAWIEVEYAERKPIKSILMREACGSRIQDFVLFYKVGSTWRQAYAGKTVGEYLEATFPTVVSNAFRLEIRKSSDGPTLWEIQLNEPNHKVLDWVKRNLL